MKRPEPFFFAEFRCNRFLVIAIMAIGMAAASAAQAQVRAVKQDILALYVFNGQSESSFRKQLDDQAKIVIDRVVKITGIDESQQQKLMLACTGDLQRFYREMEVVREQTKDLDIQNQEQMQKAWQFVSPIQQRVQAGILNETSLFKKVLAAVLTTEQQAVYDDYLEKRERALCKAVLHATIADMEKSLPLTSDQRTKLLEALEAKPFPKKVPNHSLYNVGWLMLGRLGDADVAAFLDEKQQKTFRQLTKQFENQAGGIKW